MTGFGPIEILIICGAMALLGVFLIKAGAWPARRGGRPRCAKCEYLLVGIASERCPECGSILAGKGTVMGPRTRRAGLWGSGVMLVVVALAWGGPQLYRSVDWYRWKPTGWVMNDLEAPRTAGRAWSELRRRQASERLSRDWQAKMVEAVLAGRTPPRLRSPDMDDPLMFLWEQYEAGNIRPDQVEAFFKEQTRTTWRVRPVVLVGQDVPYHFIGVRFFPKDWVLKAWMEQDDWNGVWDGVEEGGGSYYTGASGLLKGTAQQTPGEHEIQIRYHSAFYRGDRSQSKYEIIKKSKPVWEAVHVHKVKVKVLAQAGEEYLKVIEAPELAEAIKRSFTFGTAGYGPGSIIVDHPPANLAFWVFARVDGQEHFLMQMQARTRTQNHFSVPDEILERLKAPKVDLIFRSSEELAGRTLDMFDLWKGELIFEGVEVKKPGK